MSKYHYMAGLIDGEGTIGLGRPRATSTFKYPYISVSTTTPAIHIWLQNNFGGHTSVHKVAQDHYKASWSWKLKTIPEIMALLKEIEPIMLEPEKKRRAELILHVYPFVTVRNGKYSVKQRQEKEEFERKFFDPNCTLINY
jgi:hypothetical protein